MRWSRWRRHPARLPGPLLAQLCEQVKEKFAGVEPDALRPSRSFDPVARAGVKRDADELAERFAGYFAPAWRRSPQSPRGRPRDARPRALGIRAARQRLNVTALLSEQLLRRSLAILPPAGPCRRGCAFGMQVRRDRRNRGKRPGGQAAAAGGLRLAGGGPCGAPGMSAGCRGSLFRT